jgi:hypothetical protein
MPEATETPSESAPEAPAEGSDPELEKLLASLNEETAPAPAAEEASADPNAEPEVDPELAKLLKELG